LEKSIKENPLSPVKISDLNIIHAIKNFIELKYNIFVLKENGIDFFKQKEKILANTNFLFILGSQTGEFLDSDDLKELNLPNLSFGKQSYLASSVIRLIKLNLLLEG